jgi:hypothetical protein
MPIKSLNIPPAWISRIETFRQRQGYQSWSMAALALIQIGLQADELLGEEQKAILEIERVPSWGGPRPKD